MARIKVKLMNRTTSFSVGALLIYLGIGVLFLLIFWQFSYLMIGKSLEDEDLISHGQDRFARTAVNTADRGDIVDREGNILASDMESYRVALIIDDEYPNHVTNPEAVASVLNEVLGVNEDEVIERIESGIENDQFQVELGSEGRDISYNEKEALEAAQAGDGAELNGMKGTVAGEVNGDGVTDYSEVSGFYFVPETKRFYPNGNFASHLVGYAEQDSETNELFGQMGLERAYDDLLSGDSGTTGYAQDVWGYIVPNTENQVRAPEDGADIQLTIDSNIQLYVEDSLDEMDEYFEPEELFAVVADAETGEILGSGQRPSFNPRTREGFGNSWLNMLYQYSFEPGSTFKVFGLAAAIDAGVYDPDATFESGEFDVGGHTIYDWEPEGWGNITYNEGMQYSSNALMMILQDRVGEDRMLEYYQDFGFGETTDSEFPGEVPGVIAWDEELQRKTTSFGQTSTVTPIQMIQGMTAILNDGQMKKPYVIDSITDPDTEEVLHQGEESVVREVISPEAAQKTQEEINTFVDGSMERNSQYQLDEYEVAGKSGTAQIIDPDNGGYMDGPYEFLTSFIGYAPEDDPEVIIYYGIKLASENEEDTWDYGVMHGFNPLMERTLKYLEVGSQDGGTTAEPIPVEDFTGHGIEDDSLPESDTINQVVIGDGTQIEDHYPKNSELLPYDTFFIKTDGEATMPDLTGLSKREAIIFGDLAGVTVNIEGEGYVSDQSAESGAPLEEGGEVDITLTSNDPND